MERFDVAFLVHERINAQIEQMLWLHPTLSEEAKNARIVRALELFESLKPKDGSEGMPTAQMVGTHSAAMEC